MPETRVIEFKDNLHGFQIVTPQRVWRLQCNTKSECEEWIHTIHAVRALIGDTENTEDLSVVIESTELMC